jgi:CubicO group peptidase (beta-lactamase class C family)
MRIDSKSFGIGMAVGAMVMLVFCVALMLAIAWGIRARDKLASAPQAGSPADFCPVVGDDEVTQALKPIRQKYNVPGMAAALLTSEGIQLAGAVGVRKRGTTTPVTLSDLWHLGSDGKAMTSTLIARLVERGQLRWDSTIAEVFPELAPQIDPDFQKVTLLQLLSHRSGLPANLDLAKYLDDDVSALRLRAVKEELAKQPQNKPGSVFEYSNLGYIVAAAMVERSSGQLWERVIAEEVFKPLHMSSAGFGGTGTTGKIDQPWPHTADGKPTFANGPLMDNPPVMGPAGRVHCSIQDWAKFVQDQLRGARGESALLKAESYQKIQTPAFGGEQALGWLAVERGWGGGTVLNHGGDNTMNFANVWVAPRLNFAILVCINQSGDTAFKASDEAVGALIKLQRSQTK